MLKEQLLGFFTELERINKRIEEGTQLLTGKDGDGLLDARHDLDKITLQVEDLLQLRNMIDSLRAEVQELCARIGQITDKLSPETKIKLMQKML